MLVKVGDCLNYLPHEEPGLVQVRYHRRFLLVQILLEVSTRHVLQQDVQFQLLLTSRCRFGSLEEVHGLDDSRVSDLPSHLELLEHLNEGFSRQLFIVEYFTLLDNACHWQQNIRGLNFTEEDLSLTTFTNLLVVNDEELLS